MSIRVRAQSRSWVLTTLTLLAVSVALLVSSAALATPMYFAQIKTARHPFGLFSNVSMTAEANHPLGLPDLVFGSHLTGTGLGSGYVSENGPVTYSHEFTPSLTPTSVIRATLAVGLVDDALLDGPETALIQIDTAAWQSGQATFNLLHGSVLGQLTTGGGSFQVTVSSTGGDFHVLASALLVKYDTQKGGNGNGDTVTIPEPGALTLFCAGCLVVGMTGRRRVGG